MKNTARFMMIATAMIGVLVSVQALAQATCRGETGGKRAGNKSAMTKFEKVFGTRNPIIGMIHLAGKTKSDKHVLEQALAELAIFQKKGVHAAIIENYHGSIKQVEMVLKAIQGKFPKVVIGVNILPNDYALALSWSRKYGAKFIQLDFISGRYAFGTHVEELNARDYYNFRREFSEILVLGGVHPKYYKPVADSNISRDLRTAMNRADAVVVTGSGTGQETPFDKIKNFRNILGPDFPLVIGAGVTAENAAAQLAIGNGAIVGSYFKDGETFMPVIEERIDDILSQVPGGSQKNEETAR